jgi:L1 cell adhesion molecule like protein
MHQIAEAYHGTAMKLAVLIAPAYFNVPQRQATADAGKIAGLMSCISLMSPLLLRWLMVLKRGQLLLLRGMFDLGGGTFDVTLLTIEGNIF